MRTGLAFLVLGYVLSQFYRAFLAVLAPVLEAEIGASAADLARASGLWFVTFAAMQVPVGWALDRIGPRRVAAWLLGGAGGGGAALLAVSQGPTGVDAAMILIGAGCSPVLMAGYFIFARSFPPAVFGTLAGAMLGTGTLGNIAASLPLALAVEAFGWRGAVAAMAMLTVAVAVAIAWLVRDPPPAGARTTAGRSAPTGGSQTGGAQTGGSLVDVLRIPALWAILPLAVVNYAPAAGIRGLWAGPYVTDVFGLGTAAVGQVTLAMGVAMVIGNFAYGPLDRWLGSRKWVVLGGNLAAAACLLALWAAPAGSLWAAVALLAGVGLFGASFPLIMAHGRAFLPAHLTGRGITLLNLGSIGGVGVFQLVSARIHGAATAPADGFALLFGTLALALLAGCAVYLFSADRRD